MKKPTFVVIGAIKSGTTSLYYYLCQHPGIFMPPVKQLNHLISHPEKRSPFQGPDVTYKLACRNRSDYFDIFRDAPEEAVIGEVTHIYLYAPESPGLIHDVLDTPRIIAVLRNPIDRAYAQYSFLRKLQLEPLSTFEAALEIEKARIKAGWDPVFHYLNRGFYSKQLSRYYEIFPSANLKIYKFEDFFQEPASSMADLFRFIRVHEGFVPDLTKKHLPAGDPRNPQYLPFESNGVPEPKQMVPETREYLREFFAADIAAAEQLTGLNLGDWLE